jgi:hypothetical protein
MHINLQAILIPNVLPVSTQSCDESLTSCKVVDLLFIKILEVFYLIQLCSFKTKLIREGFLSYFASSVPPDWQRNRCVSIDIHYSGSHYKGRVTHDEKVFVLSKSLLCLCLYCRCLYNTHNRPALLDNKTPVFVQPGIPCS